MSEHILPAHDLSIAPDRRLVVRVFRGVLNRFLLLPLGAAIALVWANTDAEAYFRFAHRFAFPVNEIGMALFLGLIAQEIYEATMPGGALHLWRHWSLPVIGALGATAGATLSYLLYVSLSHEAVLLQAWPAACAIDIAAGYYVLRLIYAPRSNALPFLLLLAVMTDAVVIAAATMQAPSFELYPSGALLIAVAVALAALLRRRKVQAFWPYWLFSGTLSWLGLYWMGAHPALALVPIIPLLPHTPRKGEVFADRPDADAVHYAEHQWNAIAQVALFLFGLVNAGVILKHFDTGTWAVIVAAVAGRPLGVLAAIGFATAAGMHLPRRMHWRDVTVIALATSSGFTFALFTATSFLPAGAVAEQIRLGTLATIIGAALTYIAARMLRVGRFAPREHS